MAVKRKDEFTSEDLERALTPALRRYMKTNCFNESGDCEKIGECLIGAPETILMSLKKCKLEKGAPEKSEVDEPLDETGEIEETDEPLTENDFDVESLRPDPELVEHLNNEDNDDEEEPEPETKKVVDDRRELALKALDFIFDNRYDMKKGNLTDGLAVYNSAVDMFIKNFYSHEGVFCMDLVNFIRPFEQRRLSVDGYLIEKGLGYVYGSEGMNPDNRGLPGFNIDIAQPPAQK